VQLTYGGLMAGLRAATAAPTWPTINGSWLPDKLWTEPGLSDLVNNPITVQFIHRNIAYLFTILLTIWFFKSRGVFISTWFRRTKMIPLILVFLQVMLGILTVVFSPIGSVFVILGVIHQFVAMLLLLSLVWALFIVKKSA
jgi:cytochrome c oxidase assembly protein subunit 15